MLNPELEKARNEITTSFNSDPKIGIQLIKNICSIHCLDSAEQIASFFHRQRHKLDLNAVSDYLSKSDEENKKILKNFTSQINFRGQSFTEGFRVFLNSVKLPSEAQKIDRLVQSFGETYHQQNYKNHIANKDAAYILAYQVLILNTSLHNPKLRPKDRLTLNALKICLQGLNNGNNFEDAFLKKIYSEIKCKPFEFNLVKTTPGYLLTSSTLDNDCMFKELDLLLQSPTSKIQKIFPELADNINITLVKPKAWLKTFTGYEGTIKFAAETGKELANIQIYKPSLISKWLFGEQTKVIIQPIYHDENPKEAIDLAAKIAVHFESPVNNFKATYDYELNELIKAYDQQHKELTQKSFIPQFEKLRFFQRPSKENTQEELMKANELKNHN
ncbi:RalF protein, translocated into host cells by the Dot/Icm system [Legionella sainthelensi]|uniref:RalF protein, translocated into host cells by the Dot/Icm system n=2 Tax=Legionella sainthelensi TaxID=28087 RepID=A0A0W0YQA9_9GAMM|nr:T4SS guanine nucleotide exchange effector RalF [Legionella sainthelensi]KTD59072.1 RalF protein, translocated into host cells by the Dot/Icm system [Legionella sainthelensi]